MSTNVTNCSNSATDIVYICRTEERQVLDPHVKNLVNNANKAYDWNPNNCKFLL